MASGPARLTSIGSRIQQTEPGMHGNDQSGVPRTDVIGVEATIPWTFSLRR